MPNDFSEVYDSHPSKFQDTDYVAGVTNPITNPQDTLISIYNLKGTLGPKLNKGLSLTNINNVFTRHTQASINTGGNLFTSTYAALTTCPSPDFTHVRVLLKNKEASPPNVSGCIIAVTNSAVGFSQKVVPSTGNTITGDGSTGWVQVTFSGSNTVALPAGGSDSRDPGLLFSDLMPINSIAPIDGSPLPYIMCRLKLDANFTYYNSGNALANDNTKQNYFENFRFVGDGITTPANFTTPSANDPNNIIFGFEFISSSRVLRVLCVGDSITQGLHTSASADSNDTQTYSWVPQTAEILLASSIPVNMINYGYSGSTTSQYETFGKRALTTHKPAIAIYSVFSPNDNSGTVTQASTNTMYTNALDFAYNCHANNCLPVFIFLAPDENLNASQDALRTALIAKIKAKGYLVLDATSLIGDSSVPQKFIPGDKYDTLHPNRTGHGVIASQLVAPALIDLISRTFTW